MLLLLDAVAYVYLAGARHDALEPILGTAEGAAVYAAAMRRTALDLALLDVPLLLISGLAAYALARISVRPLIEAREREARFAAEAAHELRTPLARITGLAQSGGADALAQIEAIALDASATIGDLLALVREEKVAPKLAEPVDFASVARASVAATRRDGLRYDVATSADAWVVGDERRLRRLADNLLQNAARHARAAVRVAVTPDGDQLAFAVEDDGLGVPPELREQIFERFVRGSDDGTGSGLGLAICRAIARAHGGDVVLEGANRFVARLPRFALHEEMSEV
ncbi:MAG TPA: HAMP domain-containing sensor histidine kinase [Candidatus Elarobacter sp.]